jgi:hypothetical protein
MWRDPSDRERVDPHAAMLAIDRRRVCVLEHTLRALRLPRRSSHAFPFERRRELCVKDVEAFAA